MKQKKCFELNIIILDRVVYTKAWMIFILKDKPERTKILTTIIDNISI